MAGVFPDGDHLLCDETPDFFFDDLDAPISGDPNTIPLEPDPLTTEETLALMLEKENQYLPRQDYLCRIRSGQLDVNFRREACDWIWKAHSYFCFGPLSFCLSVNYLDRFLSLYEIPEDTDWTLQLLAVACLSIGIKMEETDVPPVIQLQVGDPEFVFEAKTIERMELLILSTLDWKMCALTPCTYVDHFLRRISDGNPMPTVIINKSVHLILASIRGLHFLEFKPSEIAAAAAILAAEEIQTADIEKAISSPSSSSSIHLHKVRVMECIELMKSLFGGEGGGGFSFPESPNGVLEAGCFGIRSDDIITVGSSPKMERESNPHLENLVGFHQE